MRNYDSEVCNERLWLIGLLVCNVISMALGVIIFGLSLGTIKNEIFVYEVWQFLAPIFQIACADIACGVFMCVTSGIGLGFLNFRLRFLGKLYSVVLVVMFIYQLSIGVATIIISDEKMEYVRAVAVILCVDPTLASLAKLQMSSKIEGSSSVESAESLPRLSSTFDRSPLDKIYADNDPAPASIEECSYFVNVSTPCGALIICSSLLYLYMIYCTHCIRDSDKRFHKKADNVVKRTFWHEGATNAPPAIHIEGTRRVQFQGEILSTSHTAPASLVPVPEEAAV